MRATVAAMVASAGCARGNPAFDELSAATEGSASSGGDGGASRGSIDATSVASAGGTTDPTESAGSDEGVMPSTSGMTDPTDATATDTDPGTGTGDMSCSAWQGECTLFTDGCGKGHKCAPVEVGGVWGAQCVPVDNSPALGGNACTNACGVHGGADDCGPGLLCWFDQCVPMCEAVGTVCPDAGDQCVEPVPNDPGFGLCSPECNPLRQNCGPGQACLPEPAGNFACYPAAGMGEQGAGCQFQNSCGPGYVCQDATNLEGCLETYCCTALCDVDNPMCPDGYACIEFANQSPLFPNVGVCVL